eukprot:TRINITY_DN54863_c0_g1_i1.p2 TRINITY_DN54863_c0_g1~~TRINITY_DN54863_c0_g1_i1.p2  ORF type:complete len:578 (-),score=163.78 TRINITY_DN54863_c0_g1_i1:156-1802(-)
MASEYKCAECAAAGCDSYCVELKKVLCPRCIGRLCPPECKKAAYFTIEKIDFEHQFARSVTTTIIDTLIFVGSVWALLKSGVGAEYFSGANICPSLHQGRHWLAHADANVFYYFKTSLSMYCDIEDSFWRLIMDGWVRGVVSGSDSVLLLASTLPKALVFKTMAVALLVPVLCLLYGALATVISFAVIRFEDVLHQVIAHVSEATEGYTVGNRVKAVFRLRKKLTTVISKLSDTSYTYRKKLVKFSIDFFKALAITGVIRLVVRYIGLSFFPSIWQMLAPNVSNWQLLFEPITFYYLAGKLATWDAKFDKKFPKKKAAPAVPLTLWRQNRPMADYMEGFNYGYERVNRTYQYYRKQAEGVVLSIVEDLFNAAIALRIILLIFGISYYLRFVLRCFGLGGLLDRHAQWFQSSTGFVPDSKDAMYPTERLLSATTALWGVQTIGDNLPDVEWLSLETAWSCLWRLAVPALLYYAVDKWNGVLAKQQKAFKKSWEGPSAESPWKGGLYEQNMEEYGTFWNVVDKNSWNPVPAKRVKKLETAASRLFDKKAA